MALRAMKTDEELSTIPIGQPVLVELPGYTPEPDDEDEQKQPNGEPDKLADEPSDDGAKKLQEQIDALNASRKAETDRLEKEAADARRRAKELEDENRQLKAGRVEDEGTLIQNALKVAQSDLAAAQSEYEAAFEEGDKKAMSAAQAKIGRATAQIVRHEDSAAVHAQEQERAAKVEKTQERTAPAPSDPIAAIDANPNLLPAEKDWLKSHPDAWTDPRRNQELGVAYDRSMRVPGMIRGSAEQFKYIEEFMGYAKPSNTDQERDVNVSAPPSRQDRGGDGRPMNNRIVLTPEEREVARNMGVSDTEYARQKVAFEAARKADPEKYSNR